MGYQQASTLIPCGRSWLLIQVVEGRRKDRMALQGILRHGCAKGPLYASSPIILPSTQLVVLSQTKRMALILSCEDQSTG